jgi:hypothetical protein
MLIHPDELSRAWIDRLASAKIKAVGIHPCGGENAHKSLENFLELAKTSEFRSLIDYAKNIGLDVEYEFHAIGYLLPRALFDKHPEYFRVNKDGVRTSDNNLCVSNPEAMRLVAKNASELASSLYKSSHNFYFWLDDGWDLKCHCPLCKHLSASDQQIIVINNMLREIKKTIPDARMAYLAYMDTVVPPTDTDIEDGVFLEYAPFAKYTVEKDKAMLIEKEKEMMIPLMRVFDRHPRKVLEYWYDNSLFSKWKKPPKKFVLDEVGMLCDIAEYKKAGFNFISTFACYLGEDYRSLHGDIDIIPFSKAVLD